MLKKLSKFQICFFIYLLTTFMFVLLETIVLSVTGRVELGVSYIDLFGFALSLFWLIYSFKMFRSKRSKSWLIISFGAWLMLISFGLSTIFSFVYSLYAKGYPRLEYASYVFPGLVLFNKYDQPMNDPSKKLISSDPVFFFPSLVLFALILISLIITFVVLKKKELLDE